MSRQSGGDRVPEEVWDAVRYEVARAGDDCADNFRAYRVRGRVGFKRFLEQYRSGCCGTGESACLDARGDKWVIGWNYGH